MSTRRTFAHGAAAALVLASAAPAAAADEKTKVALETIVYNAKITTFDPKVPKATALGIYRGRVVVLGNDATLLQYQQPNTRMIDAKGKTVIPGLNDAQLSLIRAGLTYTAELRWDGVPTIADALRMLKVQAGRTPAGQWVRVVGGWSPQQFAEKRMPTVEELDAATGAVPTLVTSFGDGVLLNAAGLRAFGGNAPRSVAAALAKLPRLSQSDRENGTRLFMRELNRLGVTSCIDSAGAGLRYPDDYSAIAQLDKDRRITVRIAYSLEPQTAENETSDFLRWVGSIRPYTGDVFYRPNGAGPILLSAADDGGDLAAPRALLGTGYTAELSSIVTLLAQNDWPFAMRATTAAALGPIITTIERVNAKVPFNTPWWLVGAEAIDAAQLARVAAIKGGIIVPARLAYRGEASPPLRAMVASGVTLGAGTDGTQFGSYNPWVALYWLVTQRTIGGAQLGLANALQRDEALRAFTAAGAWFSNEEDVKGTLGENKLADLAILSDDYFSVPEKQIPGITADLTMLGGNIVHAQGDFASLAPPSLAASPSWSPIAVYGAAHAPVVR